MLFLFSSNSGLWSQQEFPSSETGLTYTIARAGLDSCRRRHHQSQAVTPDQQHHQQLQRQSQRKYANSFLDSCSFSFILYFLRWFNFPYFLSFPESLCSSGKTQSTAVATQKLSQDWSASKLQAPPHQQSQQQTLNQTHASLSKQQQQQLSTPHYHHQHSHHHHNHNNQQSQQQQQQNTQHQYVPQIQHQHQHHHQHLNNE